MTGQRVKYHATGASGEYEVWGSNLDPLFDWRQYQRAQAALAVDPGPEHPHRFEPRPAPQPPQSDTRKGSRRKR